LRDNNRQLVASGIQGWKREAWIDLDSVGFSFPNFQTNG